MTLSNCERSTWCSVLRQSNCLRGGSKPVLEQASRTTIWRRVWQGRRGGLELSIEYKADNWLCSIGRATAVVGVLRRDLPPTQQRRPIAPIALPIYDGVWVRFIRTTTSLIFRPPQEQSNNSSSLRCNDCSLLHSELMEPRHGCLALSFPFLIRQSSLSTDNLQHDTGLSFSAVLQSIDVVQSPPLWLQKTPPYATPTLWLDWTQDAHLALGISIAPFKELFGLGTFLKATTRQNQSQFGIFRSLNLI